MLTEDYSGLPIDIGVTEANGSAEREAAIAMLNRLPKRTGRTLTADKAYDATEFVAALPRKRLEEKRDGPSRREYICHGCRGRHVGPFFNGQSIARAIQAGGAAGTIHFIYQVMGLDRKIPVCLS